MSQGIIARSIAAEMARGFLEPVWREDLARSWRRREGADGSEPVEMEAMRLFLSRFVDGQRSEVNAMAILRMLTPAIEAERNAPETTARGLISAVAGAYATDPVDTDQIRTATVAAYAQLETVGDDRKSVSDGLVLCRRADDVLASVETAVEQFLADRETAPHLFKTASERDRLTKVVLADVATERRYLASARASLVALDERRSDARDEVMRALATLTLFNNMGRQDLFVGDRQNKPPLFVTNNASFAGGNAAARTVVGRHG